MVELQHFEFLPIFTFVYFLTLKGYISCREKGHIAFFHNSRSTIGVVASKIIKKPM